MHRVERRPQVRHADDGFATRYRMSTGQDRAASIRIGVGAGTADDRIGPAIELAQYGDLDYLVFECLAERTVARENLTRSKDPERGYTPRMLERIEAVLPTCLANDVRIVTNMVPPIRARAPVPFVGLGRKWLWGTSVAPSLPATM
jgi:hypothetical protein